MAIVSRMRVHFVRLEWTERMSRLIVGWVISCLAIMFGSVPALAAPDRVALVIGNGSYRFATALPNPKNDARSLAKSLGSVGFDVTQGEDLDRASMERLLRGFFRKAEGAKVALLEVPIAVFAPELLRSTRNCSLVSIRLSSMIGTVSVWESTPLVNVRVPVVVV